MKVVPLYWRNNWVSVTEKGTIMNTVLLWEQPTAGRVTVFMKAAARWGSQPVFFIHQYFRLLIVTQSTEGIGSIAHIYVEWKASQGSPHSLTTD
jgi:hypothetical protein